MILSNKFAAKIARKFVFTSVLVTAPYFLNAEDIAAKSADTQTTHFEEIAKQWLPQYCFHSGTFEQKRTLPGLPNPLISSGSYVYSCEKGLIWAAQSPVPDVLVFRKEHSKQGSTLKISEKGEVEKLSGRAERAIAEMLTGLLGGDLSVLKKRFDLQASADHLVLSPRRKQIRKFLQEIKIEKEDDLPVTRMFFTSGETQSIFINNVRTHELLGEEQCINEMLPDYSCKLIFGDPQHVSAK